MNNKEKKSVIKVFQFSLEDKAKDKEAPHPHLAFFLDDEAIADFPKVLEKVKELRQQYRLKESAI